MYSVILAQIYIHESNIASLCNEICSDVNILNFYSIYITQEEIEYEKYRNLKYLDLSDNYNVKSLNHLKHLIYLNCARSTITQEGISQCKSVRIFNADYNDKITSINDVIGRLRPITECPPETVII